MGIGALIDLDAQEAGLVRMDAPSPPTQPLYLVDLAALRRALKVRTAVAAIEAFVRCLG